MKEEQLEPMSKFAKGQNVMCLPLVFNSLHNEASRKSIVGAVSPLKAFSPNQMEVFNAKGVESLLNFTVQSVKSSCSALGHLRTYFYHVTN